MRAETRLKMSMLVVALSAAYGVVIAADNQVATVMCWGYIAVVLVVILVATFWRKR